MFLRYLSGYDYEERYWTFILRFETIIHGIVLEIAKRVDLLTDEQASEFFLNSFSRVLDVNAGVTPPGWWENMAIPPLEWYKNYVNKEVPYMIKESRRLALSSKSVDQSSLNDMPNESFDRAKIKRLAHSNPDFQKFLLGDSSM